MVPQIQYIADCLGKTNSLNLECSETVEDDLQNAIQRWCYQCPCRDALVVPTIQNKKKKLESFREPCELPDCLCSENCIV